ncbi:MAG: tryptophan synthase subunit alpha [Gammaproteobacteria bacterium]|nr:tryptophan synthase subunit alpha [Gammaproteobacteria bacterium]
MKRLQSISATAVASQRKLLIPYLVAGDPEADHTLALMHEVVRQGADIIELGFPFSDPASDGPVIQQGIERALASKMHLGDTLDLVRQFRKQDQQTGIVLMGYLNPIEIMGYEAFVNSAAEVGVDGVLIVDMPPTESGSLHVSLRAAGIDTIYLLAPTTDPERAAAIADHCSGYLYYVSLKGVTGAALTDQESVAQNIDTLRQLTDLPIVIGFGIKDAASACAMAGLSDGIIIGSALVSRIGELAGKETVSAADLRSTCEIIGIARTAIDSLN